MKYILISLLTLATIQSFSQITSTWKGNTPGHEVQWDYAPNWSNNRVPDEFTDVVIPFDNTLGKNYPVVRTEKVEINSLCIMTGAQIQIETACSIYVVSSDLVLCPQTLLCTKELAYR